MRAARAAGSTASAAARSRPRSGSHRSSIVSQRAHYADVEHEGAAHDGEDQPLIPAGSNFSTFSAAALMKRCDEEPVSDLILSVRRDIKRVLDTALSYDEQTSVDINIAIVRPLALKYTRPSRSLAILFALMVNRVQFQRDAENDLAFQSVNASRAILCELLAIKMLRAFSRDGLELITALTAPFSPSTESNANSNGRSPQSQPASRSEEVDDKREPGPEASALELALHSGAKKFIASPLCQRVINGIWSGKVVVTNTATPHAMVQDAYKARRPLALYDPASAPLLDHYRLRVPMIRARLELMTLLILCSLYVLALKQKGAQQWTMTETFFTIWLIGYTLDEVAQLLEHGTRFYLGSLWNLLDSMFCGIGLGWLGLRLSGLLHHDAARSDLGFDLLALGAIILFPRLLSSLFQDNPVLLALKEMIYDFISFFVLAIIAMCGFLFTFYSLGDHEKWGVGQISWLMAKIWFGNSYVAFDTANEFSKFGPFLMVVFAITANTLLLTVLISILSSTFQTYQSHAAEEAMYQHATNSLTRLSSDAMTSYVPPLNIVCILVVWPASFFLDPHSLHRLNVALIRLLSWPILLWIRFMGRASFQRRLELTTERAQDLLTSIPHPRRAEADVVEAAFAKLKSDESGSEDDAPWKHWTGNDPLGLNADQDRDVEPAGGGGQDDDDDDEVPATPVSKRLSGISQDGAPSTVDEVEEGVGGGVRTKESQATPRAGAAGARGGGRERPTSASSSHAGGGFGDLSSPIGRLFALRNARSSTPPSSSSGKGARHQPSLSSRQQRRGGLGKTGGQGMERQDDDLADDVTLLLHRLNEQQKMLERLEELVLQLTPPPPAKSSGGERAKTATTTTKSAAPSEGGTSRSKEGN